MSVAQPPAKSRSDTRDRTPAAPYRWGQIGLAWLDRVRARVLPPARDLPGWLASLGIHLLALLILLALRIHAEVEPDGSILSVLDDIPSEYAFDAVPLDQTGQQAEVDSLIAVASVAVAPHSAAAVPAQIRESFDQPLNAPRAPSTDEAAPWAADDLASSVPIISGGVENLAQSGGVAGAMDRLTFEIMQSLHERETTVIWLFDRSESLKERRNAIADRFENVYRQLASLEAGGRGALTTVAATFGEKLSVLNETPADDIKTVIPRVRRIENDPSGRENVFAAVHALATQYRGERAQGRNVLLIIITDERGDDAERNLEQTILLCRRLGVRVYTVGNAAPFGRERLRVSYTYPDGTVIHDAEVDAGPETVEPEALALGFWGRRHSELAFMSSGYGPYALSRLSKETGGLYFITQEDRRGPTFAAAVMRNYTPDYRPIRDYTRSLEKSRAKGALVMAAKQSAQAARDQAGRRGNLDELQLPRLRFQAYNDSILREEMTEAQKPAAELSHHIEALVATLLTAEREREKISEPRWRAGYDLAIGRALAMKARLLGYNQMLAEMKGAPRSFRSKENNEWRIVAANAANAGQVVKKLQHQATKYLQRVIDEHPETPWSYIAQIELSAPLGWEWQEGFNPASFPPNTSPDEVRRRVLLAEEEARNRPRRPAPATPRERPRL